MLKYKNINIIGNNYCDSLALREYNIFDAFDCVHIGLTKYYWYKIKDYNNFVKIIAEIFNFYNNFDSNLNNYSYKMDSIDSADVLVYFNR